MRVSRLQLFDFRNFQRLNLSLSAGATLLVGGNAQGKTNLLEAIYLLATMRSPRADSDAQLIRRQALADVAPAARVLAQVETAAGPLKAEVIIAALSPSKVQGASGPLTSKVARINGLPKRLAEAVGHLNAVLFTAADLDLVTSGPSLRRRYLDITISQVDRAYLAALQRYAKVLLQRNHLLRRLREGAARLDELSFWNEELVRDGAYILSTRARAITHLGEMAAAIHGHLAGGEELQLAYLPCLSARQPARPGARRSAGLDPALGQEGSSAAAAQLLAAALPQHLEREIDAGATLLGPHRDDLLFAIDGVPAAGFASRAQQRTIALSLRLAEARYLMTQRGESPVILLDDILSEMDADRRHRTLEAVASYQQVLITATDLDRFPEDFLAGAALYAVVSGGVSTLTHTLSLKGRGQG